MKHDPRHIILLPLLAIIMAACSDTPLPAPAPAPGDTATVIFSLNLNSSSPTASRALSRAESTEIRTAWDPATDPAIIPGWWTAVAADRFADITAGTLIITYSTADNTPKRLAFTAGSINLHDANTPAGAGDLAIELTAEQAAAVAASGLSIGSYNVTITKITYSVTTVTTDPQPTEPTEYTLTEEEREFPSDYDGAYAKRYVFDKGIFTQNEPVVGGNITVTVKVATDIAKEVVFFTSNKYNGTNVSTYTEADGSRQYKYAITEDVSNSLKAYGLDVLTYEQAITKITYTATIGSGGTGGEDPKPSVEGEEYIAWEGSKEFSSEWVVSEVVPIESSVFKEHEPLIGGKITITMNPHNPNNTVDLHTSNDYYTPVKLNTYKSNADGSASIEYELTEAFINELKQYGLKVHAYSSTITQITYTAKKAVAPGPDPIDPGLLWKDEYNPGDEDAADCVIDPAKLHLLIYDSDTEKLIAWVKDVRLTEQTGDDRHYGGELSISLEAFKDATGGTRTADGTTTSNAAGITESVNEVTVIALANWSTSVVTPLLTAGSTIAQLEAAAATFAWNAGLSAKDNGYIPMWGQSRIHVDFSTDNLANLLDIKLLRSLAKVKIMLKDNADSPASSTAPYYDIASVKVNNYAPQGYYMPSGIRMATEIEGAAIPLKPATTELSVADCINAFTTAAPQSTPVMMLPSGVKSYILYLPEQLNDAESATPPSIDISIKSLHAGNDIPVGDTVSGTLHFTTTGLADEAPKNIIRNHQYDFTVRIDGGLKFSVTVADMIDGGTYSYEYVIK